MSDLNNDNLCEKDYIQETHVLQTDKKIYACCMVWVRDKKYTRKPWEIYNQESFEKVFEVEYYLQLIERVTG